MSAQWAAWGPAGLLAGVAAFAAWRGHRRRHRRDPDRVGTIDWTGVQALALIGALVAAGLAAGIIHG